MLVKNDQFPFYDEKNTPYLEKGTAVLVGSYEGEGNFVVVLRNGCMYPAHLTDLAPLHEDVVKAIQYYMYGELGVPVPLHIVNQMLCELLKIEPTYLKYNDEEDVAVTLCGLFRAAHGWNLQAPLGTDKER